MSTVGSMSFDAAAAGLVVVADPAARAVAGELLDGTGAVVVDAPAVTDRGAGEAWQVLGFWIGGSADGQGPALYHLGVAVASTRPLVVGVDGGSALCRWLTDELARRRPGLVLHTTLADVVAAVRTLLSKQEQGMRPPLITGPVRDELVDVLLQLGGLKEISAAFAQVGLPDPVPEDGRVNKSPKRKLISRYFDAIDWTDTDQVRAVLRLCTQGLMVLRNEARHRGDVFEASLYYLNPKNALASDGYGIDEQLRIVELTGPAPVDEPLPRYSDPEQALDAAIHEALSAAQTVRQMLDREGRPILMAPQGQAMTWQVRDATEGLLSHPVCMDLEPAIREAFEHLGGSAVALFTFTHKPYVERYHVDQSTAWIAQVTLRAWAQAALELLEVVRGHRPVSAAQRGR